VGYATIKRKNYELGLSHELEQDKTGGMIYLFIGGATNDLEQAILENDQDKLKRVRCKEIEGDTLQTLERQLHETDKYVMTRINKIKKTV